MEGLLPWYEGDCLSTIVMEESLLKEKISDFSDVEEEVNEMCLYGSDRHD